MSELTDLVNTGKWQNVKQLFPVWGLLDIIQNHGQNLKGIEIGVHAGVSSYLLLSECPNVDLLIGIDHYQQYEDWNGTVTQATQDTLFEIVKENAAFMGPRFKILRSTSTDIAPTIENESLDFIYIDGDHSTEAVYQDLFNYVPKVKNGGIIAGHDIGLVTVEVAIRQWRNSDNHKGSDLVRIPNNSWYWIKN